MFDTVVIACPRCGHELEEQTKSGPCILARYTLRTAPAGVLGGLDTDEVHVCKHCGTHYKVGLVVMAYTYSGGEREEPNGTL